MYKYLACAGKLTRSQLSLLRDVRSLKISKTSEMKQKMSSIGNQKNSRRVHEVSQICGLWVVYALSLEERE